MTQEEKLKEAKKLYESANADQRYVLESLFPELRESEDERIRKGLIEYFLHYPDHEITYYGLKADFVISWLEKQGENNMGISEATKQKLDDNLNKALEKETPESWNEFLEKQGKQKLVHEIEPIPIFRIGDILKRKGRDYTFKVDRIQGGYYHYDRNNGAFFPIEEQDNWELIEQKPAWSEEDSDMLDDIVKSLKKYQLQMPNYRVELQMRWLKSLKDRIQPQPKQKWSEEDEDIRNELIKYFTSLLECIATEERHMENRRWLNWLKSLKDRYAWKPSESDIRILEQVIDGTVNPIKYHAILYAILEQLKKLRE